MDNISKIRFNIRVHDKVAARYEVTHGEIYNPIEQARLNSKLRLAISEMKTNGNPKQALDFGCGAGNLTNHLLDLGLTVVSSDISPVFLELIKSRFGSTGRSETKLLNGADLADMPNETFDMAATFSVLHHIPDYLEAVKEMARILKPGGILYLDHEVNESYWNNTRDYLEFKRLVEPLPNWKRFLSPVYFYNKVRLKFNPRFRDEGDIHVFPDDHIEWDKIEKVLFENGCETVVSEDYLLYRRHYPKPVFDAYRNRCNDMRLLISRKRPD